ncbi:MAG: HAD-superfamily subfamily hydrolase, partial [Chloroflexi bacterium]|nr:HAD-superfamily subfamily hydrolase [Chloroflexota bacterium]
MASASRQREFPAILAYSCLVTDSRVAALFDVDHTLLDVDTGLYWARHQHRAGMISTANLLRASLWMIRYRLARLDQETLIGRIARMYAGTPVAQAEAEVRGWFETEMTRFIRPAGLDRVREHIAAGHIVALVSSGTRYTLEPLARLLGISHVLCTAFEERDGLLTGKHVSPACAGLGKVVHAERFAAEQGVDLAASYFYTDSYTDLSLLSLVHYHF